MNDSERLLNDLKDVLGPSDDDDFVLLSFLEQAKDVLLNRLYPYMSDDEYSGMALPTKYEKRQVRIAVYLLNKRGAEGETQHIENGIHRNYKSADVPEDMLRDVVPFVGIPR